MLSVRLYLDRHSSEGFGMEQPVREEATIPVKHGPAAKISEPSSGLVDDECRRGEIPWARSQVEGDIEIAAGNGQGWRTRPSRTRAARPRQRLAHPPAVTLERSERG